MYQILNSEFHIPIKREQIFIKPSDNRIHASVKHLIDDGTEQSQLLSELDLILSENNLNVLNQSAINIICSFCSEYIYIDNDCKTNFISIMFTNAIEFFKFIIQEININKIGNAIRNGFKFYCFTIDWCLENYLGISKQNKLKLKKNAKKAGSKASKLQFNSKNLLNSKNNIIITNNAKSNIDLDFEDITEIKDTSIIKDMNNMLLMLIKVLNCKINSIFIDNQFEDELINLLIKIGFDMIEILSKSIDKSRYGSNFKENIFSYLQILSNDEYISNSSSYLNLKIISKIVKLLYDDETLVDNLSDFVVNSLDSSKNSSINSLGIRIIQEIVVAINKEKNYEGQGLKNVTKFLIKLSLKNPRVIYSNLSTLLDFYYSEMYIVRNTISEMLHNIIIILLLKKEDLDEDTVAKHTNSKNTFINYFFERLYDKNSFVRCKILNIFSDLIDYNAVDYSDYNKLINECYVRTQDNKSIVRKSAFNLAIKISKFYISIYSQEVYSTHEDLDLIIKNASKSIKEIENKLELNKDLIQQLDPTNIYKISLLNKHENSELKENAYNSLTNSKNKEDNNNLLNQDLNNNLSISNCNKLKEYYNNIDSLEIEIEKKNNILALFTNYKNILNILDKIVNVAIYLLNSKSILDVLSSIELIQIFKLYNIQSANIGIRKVLSLIVKPEDKVVTSIVNTYYKLFLSSDISPKIQALNLIEICSNLNISEQICLKKLISYLVNENKLSKETIKEIWKIFLRSIDNEIAIIFKDEKIDIDKINNIDKSKFCKKIKDLYTENRIALQLINIISEFDEDVLYNNSSYLLSQINILVKKRPIDWVIIKESIIATQKIYLKNKETAENCLIQIIKLLINFYGTTDIEWNYALSQLINTLFEIMKNPDIYCKYLLTKLSKPLFTNKLNIESIGHNFSTQYIAGASKIKNNNYIEDNNINRKNSKSNLNDSFMASIDEPITTIKLSQLVYLIGHVALNLVIYCEKLENELKKKQNLNANKKKEIINSQLNINENNKRLKKTKNNVTKIDNSIEEDDLDLVGGGNEALLEFDVMMLHETVENDLLASGLLGIYSPFIVKLSRFVFDLIKSNYNYEMLNKMLVTKDNNLNSLEDSKKNIKDINLYERIELDNYFYNSDAFNYKVDDNILLYKSTIFSLCKMMTISSKFCINNIEFLFEILECSVIHSEFKLNIIATFADLVNRFPNVMQNYIVRFTNK